MHDLDEPRPEPAGPVESDAWANGTVHPPATPALGAAPATAGRRRSGPWRTAGVALAGALVGGAVVTAAVPAYRVWAQGLPQITTVPVPTDAQSSGAPAVSVYRRVSPAIVLVTNNGTVQNTFFGPQSQTAYGSGVIFSSDGYIVTNDHVVQGASRVTVTLADGTTYPAHVIGGDVSTDLAVIKIDATKPLPTATFANSNDVAPGELAIAIGNPLGPTYAQSVTQGIVGAVRPMLYGLDQQQPRVTTMIQTDAPVNPGNSGGALCNAQGQVIGIVSMKQTTAEPGVAAVGLSFAIPSNTVQHIVDQIVKNGYVKWAWLGIEISESPSNALPSQPQTLTVGGVTAGGPSQGKLQAGDVLSSWNGHRVVNYWDLVGDMTQASPGQTVGIGVLRGGKPLTVQVTLGTESKTDAINGTPTPAAPSNQGGGNPTIPWPYPFPFGP